MNHIIRFFIFLGFIAAPFLSNASVTAHFTSTYSAGCGAATATPIPVSFTDNSTTSAGTITYHSLTIRAAGGTVVGATTAASLSYNVTDTGSYTVTDTAINSLNDTNIYTQTYYYAYPPTVNFRASNPAVDTHACPGHVVTFQNISTTVAGCSPSFNWTIQSPTGATTNFTTSTIAATITYTFATPGTYSIYLGETSCSPYVCFNYIFQTSYIHIDSIPVACFTNNDSTPCSTPAVVTFANCSQHASSYLWVFGDGTTSTLTNPTNTYSISGTITDKLVAYSSAGCPDTLSKTGNIIISNFTPAFTLSASSICGANSITSGTVACTDATAGATSFSWIDNYIPAHTSTVSNPVFTYATPGTYTITETVSSNAGCTDSISHTITVMAAPVVAFTSDTVYRCSPNLIANFTTTVTPAAPLASQLWAFGDAGSATTLNPTHTYTVAGTYSVSLTATGTNGCASQVINPAYIKIAAPVFNISIPIDSGCVPFAMVYSTGISSPAGITYSVSSVNYGDGTIDTPPLVDAHNYTAGGVYPITVNYTLANSAGGCAYTKTITATAGIIKPVVTPIISTDSICPASTFSVSANCPLCTSLRWKFQGGYEFVHDVTSWDTTNTYAATLSGKQYIYAIGNDAGCTDTVKDSIYIVPPSAGFTSSVNCAHPTTVSYSVTAATVTSGASGYHWDFGDATTGTGIHPAHTYTTTGQSYTVTLVDSATTGTHMCTNTYTLTVNVFPYSDTLKFHVTDSIICHGQSTTFSAPTPPYGGSYAQFLWHFGDGTTATIASPSHTYAANGIYSDTLIIKNNFGCLDTLTHPGFIQVSGPTGSITASELSGCADPTFSANLIDNNTDLAGFTITHYWIFNGPPAVTAAGAPPVTPVKVIGTPAGSGDTSGVVFPEGTYQVIVLDTDNNHNRCFTSDTITIRSQKPHAYFYSPDSTIQACIGVAIPFFDTNTNCTYAWNFGDGATLTGTNASPTHIYTANGTYTVSIKITTLPGGSLPVGCTDTFTSSYTVVVDTVNVGFTLSTTTYPCPPLAEFGTNTTTPINGYTYQWNVVSYPFSEVVPGVGSNFFDVLNRSSTITLIATSPIGCKDSVSHDVTIGGAAGTLTITTDSGCAPVTSTIIFHATDTGAVSSILWAPGDGATYTTTDTFLIHTYVDSGIYHPTATINEVGCSVIIPSGSQVANTDSVEVFGVPTIITNPSDSICYGGTKTFTATGAGSAGIYSWAPSTGLDVTTGPTVHASPTVTTTYTVTGTTIHGCTDSITVTLQVDSLFHVTITGTDSVCSGLPDTLRAFGGANNYTWSPATGLSAATGATVVATSTVPQDYQATSTDLHGCSATSLPFHVNINPLPQSISGQLIICNNTTTQLSDFPVPGTWASSNPLVASVDGTGLVAAQSVGSVTITYATEHGCTRDTTLTVKLAPAPIQGTFTVCAGSTTPLSNTILGGNWSYDPPSVITGPVTGNPATVSAIAAGFATVTYTLANGCAVDTLINVEPLPVITYNPDPMYVCNGGSKQIFANTDATSYLWEPNIFIDNNTISDPTLSDTANIAYTLTETSSFGCISKDTIPVTVYDSAQTAISNDVSICIGQSTQLAAVSSSDTITIDQTHYTWTPSGSLNNPDIADPIATPDVTTTYTVHIQENPCFSADRAVTVTVIPIPAIDITLTPVTNPLVAGSASLLTAVVTNGVYVSDWLWTPAATLSCATCDSTIAIPVATTTYTVTGTTPIGCTSQSSVTVNVICDQAQQVFVPNTFTPNGDGSNDRFYLSGKGLGLITRMSVYNRWGEEVFHAENINANEPGAGWDGTYKGQVLSPDVFIYVFELVCEVNNAPFAIKGDISLIR